jgi:hypothetical protein
MATDKKLLTTKLDEDNDDRRKEIAALKANIQKEREELRGQVWNCLLKYNIDTRIQLFI